MASSSWLRLQWCILLVTGTGARGAYIRKEECAHSDVRSCESERGCMWHREKCYTFAKIDPNGCMPLSLHDCAAVEHCMWHLGKCVRRLSNRDQYHCVDGDSHVPCHSVAKCAAAAGSSASPTADSKWAFVLTHSAPQDLHPAPTSIIQPLMKFAKRYGNIDVVMMIPRVRVEGQRIDGVPGSSQPLPTQTRAELTSLGVRVLEVDWTRPPGMLYPNVWCSAKDFIRLHIFGLEEYSAVVYMDSDVQLQDFESTHDDMRQLFQCAAQGNFLVTGDTMAALNVGMFAVKPSASLQEAAVVFAQSFDYSEQSGWAGAGFAPYKGEFMGAECMQGFLHTLLFKQSFGPVQFAFRQAGAQLPRALQIDFCKWNYQHAWYCQQYPCNQIVLLHKDAPMEARACRQRRQLGFYVHAHGEGAAALRLVNDLRRNYRVAPIYVLSDGGTTLKDEGLRACRDNYGHCKLVWRPSANDLWNPKPFLDRFREAVAWLNTDYVAYLRPGTTVASDQLSDWLSSADAGGVSDPAAPALPAGLRAHLETLGKAASGNSSFSILWSQPGLSKGSLWKSEAVLEAFQPDNIDWEHMAKVGGPAVFGADLAMAIALASRGRTFELWRDAELASTVLEAQRPAPAFRVENTTLLRLSPTEEEGSLLEMPNRSVEVKCKGCVWSLDSDCQALADGLPPRCPISQPEIHGLRFKDAPMLVQRHGDLVANVGKSGLLVATVAIQDGDELGAGGVYPEELSRVLAGTVEHARRHGHSHILRTEFAEESSAGMVAGADGAGRLLKVGWEKLRLLEGYLSNWDFSHILVLDPDATFAHAQRDTAKELARYMDEQECSILLSDDRTPSVPGEPPSPEGSSEEQGRAHRGGPLVMVRKTTYARKLLQQLLRAQAQAQATGVSAGAWEQACSLDYESCLRSFVADDSRKALGFELDGSGGLTRLQHVCAISGAKYDRNPEWPCRLAADAAGACDVGEVDIVHFQGRSRELLAEYAALLQLA
eukprot:TRINITY_DN16586_c0_g2_i1.p1 TRINITY_DN16586_c0_g2~~TRINITY_DN16586_c0_g2_i1.p1  ORF type:complete len:994 (-),score=195.81 TRINITY_DN16586_c0_g2_i1:93-3074(-)